MQSSNYDFAQLLNILSPKRFHQHMDALLWNYRKVIQMHSSGRNIWIWWASSWCFIRAQCDGIWDLHMYAFQRMLPFFVRYDHTLYARWGTVYLTDMNHLPSAVLREFQNGKFVVKESNRMFNQVDLNQSRMAEWCWEEEWRYCGDNQNNHRVKQMDSVVLDEKLQINSNSTNADDWMRQWLCTQWAHTIQETQWQSRRSQSSLNFPVVQCIQQGHGFSWNAEYHYQGSGIWQHQAFFA